MGFHAIRRAVATSILIAAGVPSILAAQAVVRGYLYDDVTGLPVQGSVMLIDPATDAAVVHATTDSLGNFVLQTRTGRYQIAAVRAGYKSVLSAPVPLVEGERLTIRVPIAIDADPTHKIGVLERTRLSNSAPTAAEASRSWVASAIAGRKAVGMGLQFDRQRLEKSGANTLGQFLQSVPGLRVNDPASAGSVQMSRSAAVTGSGLSGTMASCRVGWFMDGQRMDLPGQGDPLTDALATLSIDTIEAVEVFRGLSEMPAEFAAPDLRCGAIAIWSRRG